MVQFASYLRRVLCKTRLIFPRINGPIVSATASNYKLEKQKLRETSTRAEPYNLMSRATKTKSIYCHNYKRRKKA